MLYSVFLTFLLAAFSQSLHAEVYKCIDSKNKITYSQYPCASNNSSSKIQIDTSTNTSNPQEPIKSPVIRQLDSSVAAAIAKGDIEHAERIAVTKEQWEAVGAAKKERYELTQKARVTGRTEADLSAEKGSSLECEQAKRKYDIAVLAADSFNQARVEARQSLMRQACGIKEPTEININNTNINNHGRRTRYR